MVKSLGFVGVLLVFLLAGCGGGGGGDSSFYPIYGFDVGPYIDGQTGGDPVPPDQLRARVELVTPYAEWVRTYGCTGGFEEAGSIAHEFGLKAAMGAWLSADTAQNRREIDNLKVALAAGQVDMAIVGSETQFSGSLPEDQLIAYIKEVRDYVRQDLGKTTPVTTAEPQDTWLEHPKLVPACDVVFYNCYPYWNGVSVADATADLDACWSELHTTYPDKELIVSETGWPACGDIIGSAAPSPANQQAYFHAFVAWARSKGIKYFWFEAFDEAWKAPPPQEACFGILRNQFTNVPPYGSPGDIKGRAWNVSFGDCRVALYIKVGDGWYNKPSWEYPLTHIDGEGNWVCKTPAANDIYATEIRAYLIPEGYTPPQAGGEAEIPNVQDLLIHSYAKAVVSR